MVFQQELRLTIYLCSTCTRVHNSHFDCMQHEMASHHDELLGQAQRPNVNNTNEYGSQEMSVVESSVTTYEAPSSAMMTDRPNHNPLHDVVPKPKLIGSVSQDNSPSYHQNRVERFVSDESVYNVPLTPNGDKGDIVSEQLRKQGCSDTVFDEEDAEAAFGDMEYEPTEAYDAAPTQPASQILESPITSATMRTVPEMFINEFNTFLTSGVRFESSVFYPAPYNTVVRNGTGKPRKTGIAGRLIFERGDDSEMYYKMCLHRAKETQVWRCIRCLNVHDNHKCDCPRPSFTSTIKAHYPHAKTCLKSKYSRRMHRNASTNQIQSVTGHHLPGCRPQSLTEIAREHARRCLTDVLNLGEIDSENALSLKMDEINAQVSQYYEVAMADLKWMRVSEKDKQRWSRMMSMARKRCNEKLEKNNQIVYDV